MNKKITDGQLYALMWASRNPDGYLNYQGVYEEPDRIKTGAHLHIRRPAKFGIASISGCVTRGLLNNRRHRLYQLTDAGRTVLSDCGPRIMVMEAEDARLTREETIESHRQYHEDIDEVCDGTDKCPYTRRAQPPTTTKDES